MASTMCGDIINTYIQTLHLCECVLHSLIYILRRREKKKYSAGQYTTEKFLAASFCAVTDLKHWVHIMQNRLKREFGGGWWLTQKRAEERHFWKNDKPNIPPQAEERNHELVRHARLHTHRYDSLTCPSKLCVYLQLHLNKSKCALWNEITAKGR